MSFRSPFAEIVPEHPLWNGCKLALLGQHAGGDKAYDSSPYGNHGTLTNMDPATDWKPSSIGRQSLTLVKTSSQEVTMGDSDQYSMVGDILFSLAGWYNFSDATTVHLLGKFDGTDKYEWVARTSAADKLYFYTAKSDSDAYVGRFYNAALQQSVWQHIACTYDGSEASSGFRIYLNGSRVDDGDFEDTPYPGMGNTAAELRIGRYKIVSTDYYSSMSFS